ncbi:MAG: hypothetical protein M3O50_09275 [Myxococcota bacterium]|nr:hypothetical protein [Myxococcota bacterium]
MRDTHFAGRGALRAAAYAVAVAATLAIARPARARESKRSVCAAALSAYKTAAEREKAGHLQEARDLLSSCAQTAACGGLVPKCAARFDQVVSRMPTVVPVVSDANGSAVFDVEVKPTRPLTPSATATASPQASAAVKDEHAPPESIDASRGRAWALPRSPLPYLVVAAGLGGLIAGGLLTYWGNKDNDLARAQCNYLCRQSAADHIQTMYIAADVAFGFAGAALVVGTWLFATSSRSTEPTPPRSAHVLDMHGNPRRRCGDRIGRRLMPTAACSEWVH